MKSTRQSGMTLLEVMIAVTLFAILSVGILMALRVGLNSMGHANDRLMTNRRAAYAVRILESELNGFMPAESGVFQLTPQSPRPIDACSSREKVDQHAFHLLLFLAGCLARHPSDPRIPVIPGENNGVRLVVNERPYTGSPSTGALCLGYMMDPITNTRIPLFRPIQPGQARSFWPTNWPTATSYLKRHSSALCPRAGPIIGSAPNGPSPSVSRWRPSPPTLPGCSP